MSLESFPVEPFAEHVPDAGAPPDHKNPDSVELGAGMLELGFYVGDSRIVLASLKAGAYTELFKDGDPTSGKPAQPASSSSASDAGNGGQQPAQPAQPATASTASDAGNGEQQQPQPPAQ